MIWRYLNDPWQNSQGIGCLIKDRARGNNSGCAIDLGIYGKRNRECSTSTTGYTRAYNPACLNHCPTYRCPKINLYCICCRIAIAPDSNPCANRTRCRCNTVYLCRDIEGGCCSYSIIIMSPDGCCSARLGINVKLNRPCPIWCGLCVSNIIWINPAAKINPQCYCRAIPITPDRDMRANRAIVRQDMGDMRLDKVINGCLLICSQTISCNDLGSVGLSINGKYSCNCSHLCCLNRSYA